MYTQKIFKAGNSAVVAIPKELLQKLTLKPGNVVTVSASPDKNRLIIEKPTSKSIQKNTSDKELQIWLDKVLEEDSEILDELAKH